MKSFQKNCQQSHLFIGLVDGHQRPTNRWLGHEFYRESFAGPKCLILSKDNERDSKRTSLSNALSRNPWSNTCKIYKDSYMIFIVIFFSWRENSSSILLIQWDWLRDCESLVVKHLNTRDGLSLCGSDFVKDFTKIVEISSGLLEYWT